MPGGKQILIGWMNNWNYAGNIPTSPWRSADSVPRELALRTIAGKIQLTQQPMPQLNDLHTGAPVIGGLKCITGTHVGRDQRTHAGPQRGVRARNS